MDGQTMTLFPFLYNPEGRTTGWALLCFDGRSRTASASLRAAIDAVAPWPWIRLRLILASPIAEGGDLPVPSDLDGKAHGAYGLAGRPALVLVRPDGHIAFRSDASQVDPLTGYCRRVFGAADEASSRKGKDR